MKKLSLICVSLALLNSYADASNVNHRELDMQQSKVVYEDDKAYLPVRVFRNERTWCLQLILGRIIFESKSEENLQLN